MSKINGFVELKSEYVSEACLGLLDNIQKARKVMKDNCVNDFIEKYTAPRWFFKSRPAPSYALAVEMIDKKSLKDFFGCTLDWKVSQYYRDSEDEYNELLSCSKGCSTMLVNSKVAAKIVKYMET